MLSRKVSGSFVCLRCRLQLVGTARRPAFVASRALSSASTSVQTSTARVLARARSSADRRLYSASHSVEEHYENQDEHTDFNGPQPVETNPENGDTRPQARENDDESHSTTPPHQTAHSHRPEWYRLRREGGRIYRSRGHRVAAEQESLSIDILGREGSALVMRDRGRVKKRTELDRLDDFDVDDSGSSLIQELEREASQIDATELERADQILLNIHELRPKDSQPILTSSEFVTLKNTLVEGFTVQQLIAYMANYGDAQKFQDPSKARLPTDPPWLLERQHWLAAVEDASPTLDPLLHGYLDPSMGVKEKRAVKLMRLCWGLETYEVLERVGYLGVKLREAEFGLLLLGRQRWLTATARKYLDSGAKIIVSPKTNMITIAAPRQTAELILVEINDVLEKARTTSFDARLISARSLDPAILEEVGRLTNTVVRHDQSGEKILVTWVHLPSRPGELENSGDIVLRYLLYAADLGQRSSATLEMLPAGIYEGRYIAESGNSQRLAWHERLRRWARWIAPVQEASPNLAPQEEPKISSEFLPHPLDVKVLKGIQTQDNQPLPEKRWDGKTPPPNVRLPNFWPSEIITDTRAVFGHILHADTPTASSSLVTTSGSFKPSIRRTFLPVSPPVGSLSFPSNLHEVGLWHSILVMRFIPAPAQSSIPPSVAATAPALELRLELDHKEIKRIVDLRATINNHTGDMMLPLGPVDVRLIQTRYASIPGGSLDHLAAPVLEFLKRSEIRPWEGKLDNPSSLEGMRIPHRLLLGENIVSGRGIDGQAAEVGQEDEEMVQIDYMFASRELQRIITAEHCGYRISYQTIDAGQRGGKHTELGLEAVAASTDPNPRELDQLFNQERFLKVVSQLATGTKHFQWVCDSPDRYINQL
ncbi:mitochondrial inner-membrane-bound regulator-domain-containing protein [Apodospora peruviana]|uniref:Mitochondrial inner-membrane-bound regulator-domain-containing protein n=1 Tax=Apodospora peruviana TaxID=516989 RepID=A0AAE0IU83_9PEZI|nr:mitochondrial inner-membrane-bound regulator-domain-containing protein [Apodospora peruviana]